MKGTLTRFAILVSVAACSSTGWPTIVRELPNGEVPERFLYPESSHSGSSDLSESACLSPLRDPANGEELTLVRSLRGQGDYRSAEGRYGLSEGELLRVDCSDGRPLGVVRGPL